MSHRLLLASAFSGVLSGCGLLIEPSYPVETTDASRADLPPISDRPAPVDVSPDAAVDDIADAPEADRAEVYDALDSAETDDVFDAPDADTPDAAEVFDAPDDGDTSDASDASDASDLPDATEVTPDAPPDAPPDALSGCPRRVRLTAPLSGAITLSTGPLLEWNDGGCAGEYQLIVARDRALTLRLTGYDMVSVTGLSHPLAGLTPGVYFWKVRRAEATTSGSPVSEFRVLPNASAETPRSAIVGLMPDVNGDGLSDLVLGLPSSPTLGQVLWNTAETGTSGALHGEVSAMSLPLDAMSRPSFGARVSPLGDTNDDGFPDVLVATRGNQAVVLQGSVDGLSAARAEVISIPSPLLSQDGNLPAVVGVGDLNRDGYGDVAVGAGSSISSHVQLISFNPLRALPDLMAPAENITFGRSLAPVGDANGDGCSDFIVGAPAERAVTGFSGQRFLVTGTADRGRAIAPTLVPLHDPAPSVVAPSWVSGAGDLNGDGLGDWLWSQNQQTVFEGAGAGFTSLGSFFTAAPTGVLVAAPVGDLTGRRRFETFAFTYNSTGGLVQRLSQTGTGTPLVTGVTVISSGEDVRQVGTVGDLTGDQNDDPFVLTVSPTGAPSVRFYSLVGAALIPGRTLSPMLPSLRPHVATAY